MGTSEEELENKVLEFSDTKNYLGWSLVIFAAVGMLFTFFAMFLPGLVVCLFLLVSGVVLIKSALNDRRMVIARHETKKKAAKQKKRKMDEEFRPEEETVDTVEEKGPAEEQKLPQPTPGSFLAKAKEADLDDGGRGGFTPAAAADPLEQPPEGKEAKPSPLPHSGGLGSILEQVKGSQDKMLEEIHSEKEANLERPTPLPSLSGPVHPLVAGSRTPAAVLEEQPVKSPFRPPDREEEPVQKEEEDTDKQVLDGLLHRLLNEEEE